MGEGEEMSQAVFIETKFLYVHFSAPWDHMVFVCVRNLQYCDWHLLASLGDLHVHHVLATRSFCHHQSYQITASKHHGPGPHCMSVSESQPFGVLY